MKKIDFKKLLPHLVAVGLFAIVALLYCKPALEGKVLNQHDTQGWKGMSQQSFEVKEKTGHFPLWTNSMFGGMPAYQIAMEPGTNIGVGAIYFTKVFSLGLPEPISFFFLASLCFYILCIVIGINPWASILGAIAYAYATYDPVIISVGHNTKMLAMAYAPTVLAGLVLLSQKKYLFGFAMTALFSYIFIAQNHLQIVYYTLIISVALTVAFIIKSAKEKQLLNAVKASALGLLAGLIGLGACAVSMLPTYDYSKETMRGGASQLTIDKDTVNNKTKGGLNKDYALKWSIGKMETFTFMVPGLYGGSNGGNEHSSSALTDAGIPEENAIGMTNGYSYWGSMSSPSETTSGPVYLGAVICFLFIFGLFYVKSWHKWWILAASIIGILLAWGSNFQAFNYFMLDHLPLYSKFRAPSIAMVIPQLCIPLLASMAVGKLMEETDWTNAWKKLKSSVITTGAVILILGAFYFSSDYVSKADAGVKDDIKQNALQQVPPGQQPPPQMLAQIEDRGKQIVKALREDRKSLAGGDLLRTILLIALAIGLIVLFVKRKIKAAIFAGGLIALSAYDLVSVDKRYLSYDSFRESEEVADAFTPSAADQQILKDPDHANFRVFNQSPNFTNEAITSYHHNSIGGYHPAKLGLYQDLLEHQVYKGNMQVLDMLNTKYFIGQDQTGRPIAQLNSGAFGNCWLVKGIKYVHGANEEMLALDSTNLRDSAVVAEEFQKIIKQAPQYDSTASIKLKERQNDDITYSFNAATPQFAVFSEIYYNRGWNAYVDGQKADYAKVDYVLRGIYLPAGNHAVEFKFEPSAYYTGRTITIWCNILIYLVVICALVFYFIGKRDDTQTTQ